MEIDNKKVILQLKKLIWLYFILLIFEGALRKWILPSLATPLLIVRDPVALWALYIAYRSGMFPNNNYIKIISVVTIIAIISTLLFGHQNLLTAFYGARILLIHFPFMFLISHFFIVELSSIL